MKAVSLFSGIGGLDLGAERAGIEVILQCEIDDYCRRVLAKHWPDVRRIADVRDVAADDCRGADLIFGGFPCQPVSLAGKQRGDQDERWLWPEFARLIREVRPRFVVLENVPGLLTAGMGIVLGDLAEVGFDAEWGVLSACAFGAPHTRERVFVVAYPQGVRWSGRWSPESGPPLLEPEGCGAESGRYWAAEPRPFGVAYGVANRMERLRGLGNGVLPILAEYVFRRVMEAAEER